MAQGQRPIAAVAFFGKGIGALVFVGANALVAAFSYLVAVGEINEWS